MADMPKKSDIDFIVDYHKKLIMLNQLLACLLKSVNNDTEKMAKNIVEELYSLEEQVQAIQKDERKQNIFTEIEKIITESIASMQSQDIIRQQVDFVIDTINIICEDLAAITEALGNSDNLSQLNTISFKALTKKYCMDKQREIHQQLFGELPSDSDEEVSLQEDKPLPKIQLF